MSTAIILCSSGHSFITLEAERAEFHMGDRTVLLGQFFDTFTTSRLANRNDHGILTPHITGVGLFLANLSQILQGSTVELENLFAYDVSLLIGHTVDVIDIIHNLIIWNFHEHRHGDTLEDHTGLTLGIFDDGILGFHFLFLSFFLYFLDANSLSKNSCRPHSITVNSVKTLHHG